MTSRAAPFPVPRRYRGYAPKFKVTWYPPTPNMVAQVEWPYWTFRDEERRG